MRGWVSGMLAAFLACLVASAQDWPALQAERRKDQLTLLNYVAALSAKDVGRILSGVKLLHGEHLYGFTFLGRAGGLHAKVHVLLVKRDDKRQAYAWVEPGGPALRLPKCPGAFPGSAYDLWGEVFTSAQLEGGDGVIELACADAAWRPEAK